MRSIDFGEWYQLGDELIDWRLVGFDLDGMCTQALDLPPCYFPRGLYQNWDLADGRDNAFAKLLYFLQGIAPSSVGTPVASQPIAQGRQTHLLRLRQWNGQANDAQVEVSLFVAAPLDALGLPGDRTVPEWDGTDRWPIALSSLEADGVTPKYIDAAGYVVDGTLVALLDKAEARVSIPTELILPLHEAVLSARIVKDPSGDYNLTDGQLAGRIGSMDLIRQADRFFVRCENLSGARGMLCTSTDLPESRADYCNQMSFGMGFSASRAELGSAVDLPPPDPLCAPEQYPTDPCWAEFSP
jgi:hypothetical protein